MVTHYTIRNTVKLRGFGIEVNSGHDLHKCLTAYDNCHFILLCSWKYHVYDNTLCCV